MNRSAKSVAMLTEAELRAAPEDEYMSPAQLAFFRQRLVEEEASLRAAASETTEITLPRSSRSVMKPIGHCRTAPPIIERLMKLATEALSIPLLSAQTTLRPQKAP